MNQQSLWKTKEVQEGRTIYIPDETTFSDCQRLMGTYRVAELRPMFLQLSMLWDPSQLEEGKDKKEQALADKMKKLMKERTSICSMRSHFSWQTHGTWHSFSPLCPPTNVNCGGVW